MTKNCQCLSCQRACQYRPGWFIPEQFKDLLKYFRVKTARGLLGENKLAIDWWEGNKGTVLILAPNLKDNISI